MRNVVYVCEFRFRDMIMSVESKEGVSDFVDGFWINSDYEFTRGSDALYWIPPCRLLHVEKWTPHLL